MGLNIVKLQLHGCNCRNVMIFAVCAVDSMGVIFMQLHDRHDEAVANGFSGVLTSLVQVRPVPLPEPLTQIQHARRFWLAGWLAGTCVCVRVCVCVCMCVCVRVCVRAWLAG